VTSDEQAVREFLQPLRELAPVTRAAAAARPAGRRWGEALKLAGIALAAVALVAAIALLAHRSQRPAPAAPPPHPSVLTFLSEGGIAEHVPGTATDRWLVSNPHIRGSVGRPTATASPT